MADHNLLGAPSLDLDDSDILTGYTSAPFELEELEEMLKNDPENEMLLDIAAFKYYTSGSLDKALDSYQRLIKLNYKKQLYHFYLANTFYKLNRITEACAEWETVRGLDTHSAYGKKAEQRLKALAPGARI